MPQTATSYLCVKKREVGKSLLLLSTAAGVFICPGTASLLFRVNMGRQCAMALSIPVQLLPCSRVEAALLPVESGQKVMSRSQHHWILPTSPGNTCVQLCSEYYVLVILSLLEYLVPVQVASNFFFFFHSLIFWDEKSSG